MKFINSFSPYIDRRMLRIFLLGLMSGFPWVLIGSALTLWLKENDLSRTTIGWAGLIFGYIFLNFLRFFKFEIVCELPGALEGL